MKTSLHNQTIVEGDCLNLLDKIPAASVDLVVTSPPYNIGINYGQYSDDKSPEAYLAWMTELAVKLRRVMKPKGSVFLNVGGTGKYPWIPMDVAAAFRASFTLQNHIIWAKSISIKSETFGHFKPINSARYMNNNHEALFHFTPNGNTPLDRLAVGVPYSDKSNLQRWEHAKTDMRCAGNIWHIPYTTVKSKAQKFGHPAGFPVALVERCIQLHGGEKLVVLDPFLGAGTTLVAADNLGHFGLGFEIDPVYVATSIQRLSQNHEATLTYA